MENSLVQRNPTNTNHHFKSGFEFEGKTAQTYMNRCAKLRPKKFNCII